MAVIRWKQPTQRENDGATVVARSDIAYYVVYKDGAKYTETALEYADVPDGSWYEITVVDQCGIEGARSNVINLGSSFEWTSDLDQTFVYMRESSGVRTPYPESMVFEIAGPVTELLLPVQGVSNHYKIIWGDGSPDEEVTDDTPRTHTYAAGTFTLEVSINSADLGGAGTGAYDMGRWAPGNDTNVPALTRLIQWGNTGITTLGLCFQNCASLETAGAMLPPGGATMVPNSISYTFDNCASITELDLSFISNSNSLRACDRMVQNCTSLVTLTMPAEWHAATSSPYVWYNCSSLTTINGLENFDLSGTVQFYEPFWNCMNLDTLEWTLMTVNPTGASGAEISWTNIFNITGISVDTWNEVLIGWKDQYDTNGTDHVIIGNSPVFSTGEGATALADLQAANWQITEG